VTDSRYEMKDRIATGGMGEVWRAQDTVLGREVAVKLLKREYADDPRFRERFANEAKHAASLHHPNIATVFDFGENETADGSRPYLVMELVDGRPLSDLIRPDRPMDPDQVRDLVRQAAEALAAAHGAGIVHRDVKPANLLVTPAGRVKVTDFGIARAADSVALTSTGEVLGTPHYLSPEQAEGKVATPASDVYALGVVLFECLTGRRPFAGDTPIATALAHIRSPVPDLPDGIPDDLAAVTRRALSKDPGERYLDAAAFAAALGAPSSVFDGAPAAVPADATQAMAPPTAVLTPAPPTPASPAAPPPTDPPADPPAEDRRRLPAWWPLAALAVLGVILLVTAVLAGGGDGNDNTPAPAAKSPSTTPSATPSATASTSKSATSSPTPRESATAEVHTIDPADYEGMDANQATQQLHDLGYAEVRTTSRQNNGDGKEGTVAGISPTGEVSVDEPITLTVWDRPEKSAPTKEPKKSPGKGKKK
jgi:serine/threonine protein kinase